MKNKVRKITYITIISFILIMIGIIIAMILNISRIYSEYKHQVIAAKNDNNINEELVENYEEVSSSMGKTVEDSERVNNEKNEEKNEENNEETKTKIEETEKLSIKTEKKEEKIIQIPDPTFIKPVNGEIKKEFNKENLVYSETLKEWTTHTGIDIESDISSVVKSSADGTVKAIKNDPRYGITVIISHINGYETRYSNLLTAEFVKEGEQVKSGQTIGTIGNTATFEILDEPHLHFEILKNSEYLDPILYIK